MEILNNPSTNSYAFSSEPPNLQNEAFPGADNEELQTDFLAKCWWLLSFLNVDIDYAKWLSWLFTPFILSFLLPGIILLLLYFSALWLFVYRWHRRRIMDAYQHDFWDGARKFIAAIWEFQGWLWHGHELEGLENIPNEGGGLIVYYHGAIPIDFYYVMSKCILYKERLIRTVGDRFLFKIPGWSLLMEVFKVIPGTVSTCSSIIKDGHLLAIAPGGVYEAQFGTEMYKLLWKNRLGFAKVAIESQCCIIPMFTVNIREGFRSLQYGSKFWLWLYHKTRLPLVPIYGFFPVKMKTIIGKPIPYDPDATVDQIADRTALALQHLIQEHQILPGSVARALWQRIHYTKPSKTT